MVILWNIWDVNLLNEMINDAQDITRCAAIEYGVRAGDEANFIDLEHQWQIGWHVADNIIFRYPVESFDDE